MMAALKRLRLDSLSGFRIGLFFKFYVFILDVVQKTMILLMEIIRCLSLFSLRMNDLAPKVSDNPRLLTAHRNASAYRVWSVIQ